MIIKLLANFLIGLALVGLVGSVSYFKIFPRIIKQYRKVVYRGKAYDAQLEEIERMKDGGE